MPPEEGSPEGGQGQGAPEGAQGGQQGGQQQQGSPDGGQQQGSDDSAATIARLNAEAKKHREEKEAALARLKELEDAGKSDLERTQTKLAEEERRRIDLESQVQELTLSSSVRYAAEKAKAVDAGAVARIVDYSQIEVDSGGKPTNLDALMTGLKKEHPALFSRATGDGDGGARGTTGGATDMNELIRRGARKGAPA